MYLIYVKVTHMYSTLRATTCGSSFIEQAKSSQQFNLTRPRARVIGISDPVNQNFNSTYHWLCTKHSYD